MAIPLFLAMTGAEFAAAGALPKTAAWMACHFSSGDTGITNIPPSLPPGSLLILNDQIPLSGHNLGRVGEQLQQAADALDSRGVLLDFQRPHVPESKELAAYLVSRLTCPVAVSDLYAKELDCPVFLSPCPHHVPLSDYLLPWKGRRISLDLAVDAEVITLTRSGSQILPCPLGEMPEGSHADKLLHCHYSIETSADSMQFTLWRSREDLQNLAAEAEELGAEMLVGLYAEWKDRS